MSKHLRGISYAIQTFARLERTRLYHPASSRLPAVFEESRCFAFACLVGTSPCSVACRRSSVSETVRLTRVTDDEKQFFYGGVHRHELVRNPSCDEERRSAFDGVFATAIRSANEYGIRRRRRLLRLGEYFR